MWNKSLTSPEWKQKHKHFNSVNYANNSNIVDRTVLSWITEIFRNLYIRGSSMNIFNIISIVEYKREKWFCVKKFNAEFNPVKIFAKEGINV